MVLDDVIDVIVAVVVTTGNTLLYILSASFFFVMDTSSVKIDYKVVTEKMKNE